MRYSPIRNAEAGQEPRVVGHIEEEGRVEQEQHGEREQWQDGQHRSPSSALHSTARGPSAACVPFTDYARKILEDLGEVAARLVWIDRETTNIRMSSRSHRSAMLCKRVAELRAVSHFVDDHPESGTRSGPAFRSSAVRARRRPGARREARARRHRARPGTAPPCCLRVRVAFKFDHHQWQRRAQQLRRRRR